MISFLVDKLHDARFMTMLLAAIAASATAYTLIMPLFAGEGLAKRMKAVASERERIRQRERDRLSKSEKVSLRQSPKQLVSKVVDDFNLGKWLAQEAAREKLTMAGYRGQARISRRARPAADQHRIRHVDRSGLPQGQHGDRVAVGCALRGIHADHGRALLSPGSQGGLRKSGEAHRPRGREVGLSGLAAVGTLRHAAWTEPARHGAGKSRHAHERGREEGGRAAAETDRADDPVLPAGVVRRHPGPDLHQGRGNAMIMTGAADGRVSPKAAVGRKNGWRAGYRKECG